MLSSKKIGQLKQAASDYLGDRESYVVEPSDVLELVNAVEKMREALENIAAIGRDIKSLGDCTEGDTLVARATLKELFTEDVSPTDEGVK